jgi:hypothetical protein
MTFKSAWPTNGSPPKGCGELAESLNKYVVDATIMFGLTTRLPEVGWLWNLLSHVATEEHSSSAASVKMNSGIRYAWPAF